jgi:putative restriction endonuclease
MPTAAGALRRIVRQQRAERDRCFRDEVLAAYSGRCAFTGLAIRTDRRNEARPGRARGLGRPHPPRRRPPRRGDDVRNRLPMLRTLHWMFDRCLLSAEPTGRILVSPLLWRQAKAAPVLQDFSARWPVCPTS